MGKEIVASLVFKRETKVAESSKNSLTYLLQSFCKSFWRTSRLSVTFLLVSFVMVVAVALYSLTLWDGTRPGRDCDPDSSSVQSMINLTLLPMTERLPHQVLGINSSKAFDADANSKSHRLKALSFQEKHMGATMRDTPSYSNNIYGWLSVSLTTNFTSKLLTRWLNLGGKPCKDSLTTNISIPELDDRDSVELTAGDIHEFMIHALDEDGKQRCLGGDYFETDLTSDRWKSRPPVEDHGNGSYTMSLQVHPDFIGKFNLTVVLLFRSFQGLKVSTKRFAYRKELCSLQIVFRKSSGKLPSIRPCNKSDFSRARWSGRWTRHFVNNSCVINEDGHYRCLDPEYPCEDPWCSGPLGALESNGWVYSCHCSFRIFTGSEAWNCLKNKWIFWWGDSNHGDSIRNLLNFVLFHPEIQLLPRRFDKFFANPIDSSQTVRITSIFNGHWNETMNYEGLNSLQNEGFQELLKAYFNEDRLPDVMIMNSGLHDGVRWNSLKRFKNAAIFAASFWENVLESVRMCGKKRPRLIYRTTIAPGGYARDLAFNPSKMETFNLVMVDKLRERGLLDDVIDGFDLTFPWHFDNRCNDGVHYGRMPSKVPWKDGLIGHEYFVDLMLVHILLNAICT